MKIRNFVHKGLKRLYLEDSSKGLPPDAVDKLRKMLAFLQDIEDPDELRAVPVWKAHILKGGRKGSWPACYPQLADDFSDRRQER